MPPKPKFQEGERVLCFHGPLIYEAKAVKFEVKDKTIRYFIHYNGWNKNWDEWVPETRVLKYNDQGLQKQKELKKAHETKSRGTKGRGRGRPAAGVNEEPGKEEPRRGRGRGAGRAASVERKPAAEEKDSASEKSEDKPAEKEEVKEKKVDKRKRGHAAASRESSIAPPAQKEKEKEADKTEKPESKKETEEPPRKKRARVSEVCVEPEEQYATKIDVKVKLSDELKAWLVNDWNLVTGQHQLVRLPCQANIDTLLKDYMDDRQSHADRESYNEVVEGLKDYFNVMLGSQLLYKFERAQYAEILADHPDKKMTQIYGAPHLVRLFVKLGGMLAYTPLDEKNMATLVSYVQDLMKWMSKNSSKLLTVEDYIVASPEYQRKAM